MLNNVLMEEMFAHFIEYAAECSKGRKNLSITRALAGTAEAVVPRQSQVYRVLKSIATLQKAHVGRKKPYGERRR